MNSKLYKILNTLTLLILILISFSVSAQSEDVFDAEKSNSQTEATVLKVAQIVTLYKNTSETEASNFLKKKIANYKKSFVAQGIGVHSSFEDEIYQNIWGKVLDAIKLERREKSLETLDEDLKKLTPDIEQIAGIYLSESEKKASQLLKEQIDVYIKFITEKEFYLRPNFDEEMYQGSWKSVLLAVNRKRYRLNGANSCNLGNVNACLNLAFEIDLQGDFSKSGKYYSKAEKLLLEAVSKNEKNILAIKNLARIYEHKKWSGSSHSKSKYWHDKLQQLRTQH